jgi:hypothetical protein
MNFDVYQDLQLNPDLYETIETSEDVHNFAACLQAHGVYEGQRYVIRLSPAVHQLIEGLRIKASQGQIDCNGEELQAYSTYIHETVHWWQHKGSITGFIRSMVYPLQTHYNTGSLIEILRTMGPRKSIKAIGLESRLGLLDEKTEVAVAANLITGSFMDTEFYLRLTFNPALDEEIYWDPYFEAAGHVFLVTYQMILHALATFYDVEHIVIPPAQPITSERDRLRQEQAIGYYCGSDILRAPIGLYELYEGQARFIQLQFLHFSSKSFDFDEARAQGMFSGVYGKAFDLFLELTESAEPDSIDHPKVALFLLVCDLSINPTVGFAKPIVDYENFFLQADAGVRFAKLCRAILIQPPEFKYRIEDYSGEEYREISKILLKAINEEDYIEFLDTISVWEKKQPTIANLIDRHKNFDFAHNIVPDLLFAEFIDYAKDKLVRPEFFCWAGYWLAGDTGESEKKLWSKHLSLFGDKDEDASIYPRTQHHVSEETMAAVFGNFYTSVIFYGLTKQWVLNDGDFKLDYSWLVPSEEEEELKGKISDLFFTTFGVRFEDFEHIDRMALLELEEANELGGADTSQL